MLGGRQARGVGARRDPDRDVAELGLDGLEGCSDGVGEGGGAVAEVMQPDRGEPGPVDEEAQALGEVARAHG